MFFYRRNPMDSHWSLSNSKLPQVSRNLLSILADLSNAVVWIITPCPLISKSSTLCINHLVTMLANNLMSSMYISWLIFPGDLRNLYPPLHSLRLWSTGIIAISNIKDDSGSPCITPLWNSASASFFLLLSIPLFRFL